MLAWDESLGMVIDRLDQLRGRWETMTAATTKIFQPKPFYEEETYSRTGKAEAVLLRKYLSMTKAP